MNYLAHAFLSYHDSQVQLGNLMGDFVKGKQYQKYTSNIQKGILLHRAIDVFTDNHILTKEAIRFFKPEFRLSGGILVDILFDHFLANDSLYFSDDSLQQFTTNVYRNLKSNEELFTDPMKTLFTNMTKYNWLYNYKYQEGLSKSIQGMCRRFPIIGNADKGLEIIDKNYQELQLLYATFLPLIILELRRIEEIHSV